MDGLKGLVLAAQNEKDKKLKGSYMFLHKSFGLLSLGLLGPRLVSRIASKLPGPVVQYIHDYSYN